MPYLFAVRKLPRVLTDNEHSHIDAAIRVASRGEIQATGCGYPMVTHCTYQVWLVGPSVMGSRNPHHLELEARCALALDQALAEIGLGLDGDRWEGSE